ncbi:MAG: acyltransferase [Patescibacteria group bacterium]
MNKLREVECEDGSYYVAETAIVDPNADVGPETRIWDYAHIYAGAKIGKSSMIGAGVHVESGGILGDYCKVQRGVVIYGGVSAGDYVFFGPNATTTNDRNPRSFGPWQKTETTIGTGASIGANATLIAGNEIGDLALVGAGAVVTQPVQPGQLVVGNPARFAGWVNVAGEVISTDEAMQPDQVREYLIDPRLAIGEYIKNSAF